MENDCSIQLLSFNISHTFIHQVFFLQHQQQVSNSYNILHIVIKILAICKVWLHTTKSYKWSKINLKGTWSHENWWQAEMEKLLESYQQGKYDPHEWTVGHY